MLISGASFLLTVVSASCLALTLDGVLTTGVVLSRVLLNMTECFCTSGILLWPNTSGFLRQKREIPALRKSGQTMVRREDVSRTLYGYLKVRNSCAVRLCSRDWKDIISNLQLPTLCGLWGRTLNHDCLAICFERILFKIFTVQTSSAMLLLLWCGSCGSVVKTLGYWSESHEFKYQHSQGCN